MKIRIDELNQAICKKYNLDNFNCLIALFGSYSQQDSYLISVTQERVEKLREFQSDFFESYVEDCCKIYEYLLENGYEGDVYLVRG